MAFVASSTDDSKASGLSRNNVQHQWHRLGELALCAWSPRVLSPENFLPRRGFACNTISGKAIDMMIFGGESDKGMLSDLWTVNAADSTAVAIQATGDGPAARTGAKSLLVGNAYMVFGGSSYNVAKQEDSSLYLLNTMTKAWSIARISGQKPSARTGHTFTLIGTIVFIFGGRPSGRAASYANDLWSFNINNLFAANSTWELRNPKSVKPAARAEHTAITHQGKLYIFGGTNGHRLFNDVWVFDPVTCEWEEIIPFGYTPTPRKGHASVAVAGMMYSFGGEDGTSETLGDMIALNLTTCYWHKFDSTNCVQWPPARSNFALNLVGSKLYIVGGDIEYPMNNDTSLYVADVGEISFPPEKHDFNSTNGLRARLIRSQLLTHEQNEAALPAMMGRTKQHEAVTEMDNQSVASGVGSKSIRSIKNELVREISAALGQADAEKSITRICSKVVPAEPALTAADIKSLDTFHRATTTQPLKRKSSSRSSILMYFKRNGSTKKAASAQKTASGTQKQGVDVVTALPDRSQLASKAAQGQVNDPMTDTRKRYSSIDLERFLALERSMYAELPRTTAPVVVPATKATSNIRPISPGTESGAYASLQRVLGQPIVDMSRSKSLTASRPGSITGPRANRPSIDVSSREPSISGKSAKFLKRLYTSSEAPPAMNDIRSKNDEPRASTSLFSTNLAEKPPAEITADAPAEIRTQTVGGNAETAGPLLHALAVLRADMRKERIKLTEERDAALVKVNEAKIQAKLEADARVNSIMEEGKAETELVLSKLKELVSAEATQKNELHELESQRNAVRESLSMAEEHNAVLLKRLTDAEEALSRYCTIEEEASELASRQNIQLTMIEQISAQVGFYQQRASDAEAKLEREMLHAQEAQKQSAQMQANINELQLQLAHSNRISSLLRFNSEAAAKEAESSRSILLSGLRDLLDSKTERSVKDLDVQPPTTLPKIGTMGSDLGSSIAATTKGLEGIESALAHEIVA